jgi:MarR family transcriptional regulator, organic hydroperoxide resistance regulator
MPAVSKKALPEPTAKLSGEPDYIRSHGNAGVGARLRRLSERIDRESNAVYAHLGLHFEQRWMGVLMLLDERGEMTVGELAEALRITQPSVSQTLRSLQAARIVSDKADPRDSRRRIQRLSPKGLQFIEQVRPVWVALMQTARDLDREGIDLLTPIDRIEKILDQKSVLERALGYLDNAEGRVKRLANGSRR